MRVGDFVRTGSFEGYPDLVDDMVPLIGRVGRIKRAAGLQVLEVKHPESSSSWLWPISVCKLVSLEEIIAELLATDADPDAKLNYLKELICSN